MGWSSEPRQIGDRGTGTDPWMVTSTMMILPMLARFFIEGSATTGLKG